MIGDAHGSKASALSSEAWPTASRNALSLTCRSVSSTPLTLNRYLRGSGWVYWTAERTSTRLVSAVSMLRIVRDAVLLGDVDDDLALDRPGQMPVVARARRSRRTRRSAAPRRAPARRRDRRRSPIHTAPISTTTPPRPLAKLGELWPPPPAPPPRPNSAASRRCRLRRTSSRSFCELLWAVPGIALLAARFVPSHAYALSFVSDVDRLMIGGRAF